MTRTILTAGYAGRRPDELRRLAERLDLDVVDVRLSPRSRVPGWNRGRLAALLGDRYRHVGQLGNLNYANGGPIEIADADAGLAVVEAGTRTPLLLCVCAAYETCHRRSIADLLEECGWTVAELDWNDDAARAGKQVPLPLPREETTDGDKGRHGGWSTTPDPPERGDPATGPARHGRPAHRAGRAPGRGRGGHPHR